MHDFAKSVSLMPEHESSKDTKLNINSYCIKEIINSALFCKVYSGDYASTALFKLQMLCRDICLKNAVPKVVQRDTWHSRDRNIVGWCEDICRLIVLISTPFLYLKVALCMISETLVSMNSH